MSNIFWSNIFRSTTDELQTITRLWQKTPLFDGIPPRQIEFLCRKMHVRSFLADEIVFRQGDQGAGAILILDGSVRVMANKTQLAQLETGDFFGEIALAEPERRIADAFSVDDSKLVYFLKQDLEEWIEYEPRLGARFLMNLSSTLAQRLLQANKLIAEH
ncbi:MAG: cyclic nucleotide-binding domain-containing protein [Proteobacteria bacterium]|nr:cyclic nucleotide-binding domain-containing protein [Pseudomonadota bacterium]MCH8178086.1 cyclic nucleotide-binding domain-containing protein [Pseudomonadota bacterium]